jgi:endonuclease-3
MGGHPGQRLSPPPDYPGKPAPALGDVEDPGEAG